MLRTHLKHLVSLQRLPQQTEISFSLESAEAWMSAPHLAASVSQLTYTRHTEFTMESRSYLLSTWTM